MKKIKLIPARHQIADQIKEAILSGHYQPYTELVQENIAQLLGVSRTPVREAFQLLEKDGFIVLENSKKAIVRKFDINDIKEHYQLRALLEGNVASKVANNHVDTTGLYALIAEMDAESGTEMFLVTNQQFHQLIWDLAKSPKHAEIIEHLWNRIPHEIVSTTKAAHVLANQEHRAIVAAIDQQDGALANQQMQAHILRTMNNYLEYLKQPE